jgi:hypothetical protein
MPKQANHTRRPAKPMSSRATADAMTGKPHRNDADVLHGNVEPVNSQDDSVTIVKTDPEDVSSPDKTTS